MRFVVAIVLFVVAFVAIGLGIAQRTVFAGPSEFSTSITLDGSAPATVIDGTTLNALPGNQAITVNGTSGVFIATGRTTDVLAWLGSASYNAVSIDTTTGQLTSNVVSGTDDVLPSPTGSDLWVQEYTGNLQLTRRINAPADISVLIMSVPLTPEVSTSTASPTPTPTPTPTPSATAGAGSDSGALAAPGTVSITWPLDNSAPWSGPLIVGGLGALLAGLAAFLWASLHARRSRGPRRKLPRNPKPPQLKRGASPKLLTAGPSARRGRRRNLVAASGVLLVASLALAGCTGNGLPAFTPSPTATSVGGAAGIQQTAVTAKQLQRILASVNDAVTQADAARDPKIAAERLTGPALELRAANYAIVNADSSQPAAPAIPTGKVSLILPQQSDTWPRSVFAVVASSSDATLPPVALMLTQETARDNYKVNYAITLEPDIQTPALAPTDIGAPRYQADSKLLLIAPDQLAVAYGDLLLNGDKSQYVNDFDSTGDTLLPAIGSDHKAQVKAALPSTASIDWTEAAGTGAPIALATNDSGAIVAVDLRETETVKPTEAGAAVNPSGATKALSGKSQSTKGIIAVYGLQLLFYVPPVSATGQKIQLLGFSQGLTSASEAP